MIFGDLLVLPLPLPLALPLLFPGLFPFLLTVPLTFSLLPLASMYLIVSVSLRSSSSSGRPSVLLSDEKVADFSDDTNIDVEEKRSRVGTRQDPKDQIQGEVWTKGWD